MIGMLLLLTAFATRQARAFSSARPIANAGLRHTAPLSTLGKHTFGDRISHSRLYSALTKDLSKLTVVELKGLLRAQGCAVSGRKAELIQRLSSSIAVDAVAAQDDDDEDSDDDADDSVEESERNEKPVRGQRRLAKKECKSRQPKKVTSISNGLDAEFDSIFGPTEPEPSASSSTRSGIRSDTQSASRARAAAAVAETTVSISPPEAVTSASGFAEMGLPSTVVRQLNIMGLTKPTPIQREAIPVALDAIDVMGLAQTGTGKTIAFGVPLVSKLLDGGERDARGRRNGLSPKGVSALVLAPTRELANQIAEQLRALTKGTPVKTMVVVGGQNIQTQINKLKSGTHILVATPGRLLDLMDRGALTLRDTHFLVLDEADMMLDMGFAPDLKKVVKKLPPNRQTMLFSATMNRSMAEVAKLYLKNPVRVEVARAGQTADKITQELHYVSKQDKMSKLLSLVGNHREERTLVFGRTKHGMEKLSKRLIHHGIKAGSIHGNKSQPQRDRAIKEFKSGTMKVLVATDVAARGLDIPEVKHVYNYELPNQPESYVHRIGRTARAGKEGAAIAFCSMEEMDDLAAIEKVVGIQIPVVSGTPWSRRDAKRAKDSVKKRKKEQQQAYKKKKNSQRR